MMAYLGRNWHVTDGTDVTGGTEAPPALRSDILIKVGATGADLRVRGGIAEFGRFAPMMVRSPRRGSDA